MDFNRILQSTARFSVKRYRISFGIRHLLLSVAIIALAFGICRWFILWPSVSLSNPEITQKAVLKFHTWRDPTKLNLRIRGDIDGRASITTPWGEIVVGPGEFDWSHDNDYYDRQAELRYYPEDVSKGHLKVYYNFDSF